MIDLTPLDVRKKRGDFGRVFRGYDREEVDGYLELVAERFEELVRENLTLKERTERLAEQVAAFQVREGAIQDAILTAQQIRDQIKAQAERDAERLRSEAAAEIERVRATTQSLVEERQSELTELRKRRLRLLQQWRVFLERQLEDLDLEEGRARGAEGAPGDALATPAELAAGHEMHAKADASAVADIAQEADAGNQSVTLDPITGATINVEPGRAEADDQTASGEPYWLTSIFKEEDRTG